MKGFILAGGLGERLGHLTTVKDKHTIDIGGRALIEYPILRLREEGIRDIAICLNRQYGDQIEEIVGDGQRFGCSIAYFYEAQGIVGGPARTLYAAREWCDDPEDNIAVFFGDGIFFSPLNLRKHRSPCIFLMNLPPDKADDPAKYAQAEISYGGWVTKLVEKPTEPVSRLVQTGAFLFSHHVFSVIEELMRTTPPEREISITEINQWYARRRELSYGMLPDSSYVDCGTPAALSVANERMGFLNGSSIF